MSQESIIQKLEALKLANPAKYAAMTSDTYLVSTFVRHEHVLFDWLSEMWDSNQELFHVMTSEDIQRSYHYSPKMVGILSKIRAEYNDDARFARELPICGKEFQGWRGDTVGSVFRMVLGNIQDAEIFNSFKRIESFMDMMCQCKTPWSDSLVVSVERCFRKSIGADDIAPSQLQGVDKENDSCDYYTTCLW